MRPWLGDVRRGLQGHYDRLMVELVADDPAAFQNYLRMTPAMFQEILARVAHRLTDGVTNYRQTIQQGLRLAVTLRHLATGDSYHSLMYNFRIAMSTVCEVVREVCEAIIAEYSEEVMPFPRNAADWRDLATQFGNRWQMHHALGALDGKHVRIRCPNNGGSLYYNYKGYHSIVLMALVDADYKFIWVDVGANGSNSDTQIWNNSDFKTFIEDGTIQFPPPSPFPAYDRPMPFFIVGDEAFALKTWLMKPFARRNMDMQQRIFNYRLSRARRIVENAFGILANRWGCLLTMLRQSPRTVTSIILTCVTLHNLMRIRFPQLQNAQLDRDDDHHNVIPGAWRNQAAMDDMGRPQAGNRAAREAKEQRLYLKHYYNSDVGAVPWQDAAVLNW